VRYSLAAGSPPSSGARANVGVGADRLDDLRPPRLFVGAHQEHHGKLVPEVDLHRDAQRVERPAVADDDDLAAARDGGGPGPSLVDPHLAAAGEDDGHQEGGKDAPHRRRSFDSLRRGYPASTTELALSSC